MQCRLEIPSRLKPKFEELNGNIYVTFEPVFYSSGGLCAWGHLTVEPEAGDSYHGVCEISGGSRRISAKVLKPVPAAVDSGEGDDQEDDDADGK